MSCDISQKKHALKHKDAKKEWEEHKQVPVKKEDLDYIETIINDYDFCDLQGDIRFWKLIGNHWYICACNCKEGRQHELMFKTMYIKPLLTYYGYIQQTIT